MIELGAPLVLGLGLVGPLVPTSDALEAVFAALTSGDLTQVLPALIDGPAEIANAYLNGTALGWTCWGLTCRSSTGFLVPDTSAISPSM